MSFHARTLQILDITPAVSSAAIAELDAAERRIGRKLPASVREWYSLENASNLLRRFSNDDPPIAVQEFGRPLRNTPYGGVHDLLTQDQLVAFRQENQGVCVWAFRLDDSDDPPVYVDDVDSPLQNWTKCAPTFSQHLYAWMWDYARVLEQDPVFQAQNGPLSEAALNSLRTRFEAGPETYGWPGHTQYRFSSQSQRILIWASEAQADWWLAADNDESLRQLIRSVWDLDQVGQSLWTASQRGESIFGDDR